MPGTSFMDILSRLCSCIFCKGGASNQSDQERLLQTGEHPDHDEYYVSNGTNNATYASSSRPPLSDRDLQSQARSREEEEEELMNRILDRTQQSIIDVSNLENNSLDIDMIQRSRLYAEAVKRHDAQLDRRKGILTSGGSDGNVAADAANHQQQSPQTLLANLGGRASEAVQKSAGAIGGEDLELLGRTTDLFLDAHRLAGQIECKEELIVYMSLDD